MYSGNIKTNKCFRELNGSGRRMARRCDVGSRKREDQIDHSAENRKEQKNK